MDKHELHGDAPEQSEQTEWDSLNEAVPFTKETEESPDEISEFVTDHYGKTLDKFIDVCYFDGDDRSNPDHYTVSMLFSEYLSMDEQKAIIDSCVKGESIPPELAKKILDSITTIIKKNGMIETLKTDPFMRDKRLTELTKGPEWAKGKSREEVDLTHKLWGIDDDFYTGAGISLLYNRDYLDRKCDVSSKVERYVTRFQDENGTQIKEQSLASLSSTMEQLVKTGQVSAKEIIEDPMLRKRHFDSLLDLEIRPSEIDPAMASLWRFDSDFEDSIDYSMALFDKVKDNPDIYNPDDAEIDRITDDIVEKIPPKHLAEIAKVYEKDPRKGDKLLLDLLIPYLGLEGNPPKLRYGTIKRKQEKGHYNRFRHEITICEENINDDNPDDESAKRPIFGLFKSKKPRNITYMRMNIIAHEAYHAHQRAGANVDEKRREKYLEDFAYYLDGNNSSYEDYHRQILENEAFRFGKKIEERCRRAVEGDKK